MKCVHTTELLHIMLSVEYPNMMSVDVPNMSLDKSGCFELALVAAHKLPDAAGAEAPCNVTLCGFLQAHGRPTHGTC